MRAGLRAGHRSEIDRFGPDSGVPDRIGGAPISEGGQRPRRVGAAAGRAHVTGGDLRRRAPEALCTVPHP
jgi:hypothetical protein